MENRVLGTLAKRALSETRRMMRMISAPKPMLHGRRPGVKRAAPFEGRCILSEFSSLKKRMRRARRFGGAL